MSYAERLAQSCVASDLTPVEEHIRAVEVVASMAGASGLGSDLFRARDYDVQALRRAVFSLARQAKNRLGLAHAIAHSLATAVIHELIRHQCRTCAGASEVVISGIRQVCPKCSGTGVHRWTDTERARAAHIDLDNWTKWRKKYVIILELAREKDSETVYKARRKLG